jgi:hypothetical protein
LVGLIKKISACSSGQFVENKMQVSLKMANLYFPNAGIATMQLKLDETEHKVEAWGFSIAVFLAAFVVTFQ